MTVHLLVNIRVKPEMRSAFIALARSHASTSRLEPGCLRFDFLADMNDVYLFTLRETFRDRAALSAHRLSEHYRHWREQIGEMEAEPRTREQFGDDIERAKVVNGNGLMLAVATARNRGQRIVFANGCWDGPGGLHRGHLHCLQEARKQGDVLIVGVNSDKSVRGLKGPRRPVCCEEHRVAMLAALACVDYVIVFSAETPLALIQSIRPDVLVKGADTQHVVGGSLAGRVHLVPMFAGFSTTGLLAAAGQR